MELYALPWDGVMAHPYGEDCQLCNRKCTQFNYSLRIPRFQSWEVSNLCIEQIAELIGNILTVADDSCRLID